MSGGEVLGAGVIAIIPAFNEETTVGDVVRGLLARGVRLVRVADNGSTDRTAEVARAAGAEVITEPRRGYGQACFTAGENLPAEIEWILFCDADGSDDLDAIADLSAAAPNADLVLGNRRATAAGRAAMTPAQNFGNWLAPALLRLLYGHQYADLGPLRLVRRTSYEAMAMQDRGFGWTVEMQARACELGLRIAEVPVKYFPRRGGVSKVSGTINGSVRAGSVILGTIGAFALRRWQTPMMVLAALLIVGGAVAMAPFGTFRDPIAVPFFLLAAAIMGLGFVLSWGLRTVPVVVVFGVAVIARLVLLPMEPGTDVWRYVWEGLIQNAGYNPYAIAPWSDSLAALRTDWWVKVNHPSISAVYPPLTELIFRVLAAISPTLIFFKLTIMAADLGVCVLLWRRFGTAALMYAWNPLVIYVFTGGAHYDSWFVLALVAGWLVFEKAETRRSRLAGALLIGVSVAIKYVSAPIGAFIVLAICRRHGWREAGCATALIALPFLASLAVFWSQFGVHSIAASEFSQYARSAELLPRLVAEFWENSTRMNSVFVLPFAVFVLWRLWRAQSLRAFAEDVFFALYVISPAIHAWYFTWAIPFAAASRNLGLRLVGLSGFVYFLLEYQVAAHAGEWRQSGWEVALMWGPLVLGFLWSRWRESAATRQGRPRLPMPAPASLR